MAILAAQDFQLFFQFSFGREMAMLTSQTFRDFFQFFCGVMRGAEPLCGLAVRFTEIYEVCVLIYFF